MIRLWIDGVNAASTLLTGPIRTDTEPPKLLGITDQYLIDDLRLYDEALDAAAIINAMGTPVTSEDGGAFFDFL